MRGFTYPQVASVLDIVSLDGHLLCLQNGLAHICGTLLQDEVQLLECLIDAHPAYKGRYVPHLVGAVFDVAAHVTHILQICI